MFNRQLFAASLEAHMRRRDLTQREAAKQSGVSASTFSRLLHRGEAPDMDSFGLLCTWMHQNPGIFFMVPEVTVSEWLAQSSSPLALIMYAVYGDSHLKGSAKEKLVDLVMAAYRCFAKERERENVG